MHLDLHGRHVAVRQHSPSAGEVVLFVHGLGADSSCFEPCFAAAELRGVRLVAPDLPGFGESAGPVDFDYGMDSLAGVLSDLVDALGIRAAHLVGHSMGGSIAVLLARRRPDLVSTLVVAEPNLVARDATLSRDIASKPEAQFLAELAGFVESLRADLAGSASGRAYLASFERAAPCALHRAARSLVETTSAPEFVASFLALPMAKHYLVGEKSLPSAPPPDEVIAAGVPVHVIAGAAHNLMLDNATGFARATAGCIHREG